MTMHNLMFRLLFIATIMVDALMAIMLPIDQDQDYASGQGDASTAAQQGTSSIEENKALVKSAIEEVFNQRNVSAADKYIGFRFN